MIPVRKFKVRSVRIFGGMDDSTLSFTRRGDLLLFYDYVNGIAWEIYYPHLKQLLAETSGGAKVRKN